MIPKKVKAALERLNIKNVVNGYVSPATAGLPTVKHGNATAFTCWDKDGNVVCVLLKGKKDSEWFLKP